MKVLLTVFWIPILFMNVYAQDCGCVTLTTQETTRQGFSATVVYEVSKVHKSIRGTAVIETNNEPLDDVFVEVLVFNTKENKLKRIAGCRTKANGKFCFQKLPKGNYTIRLSKDGGYMITEITLKVSPKSKFNGEITGVVKLGV